MCFINSIVPDQVSGVRFVPSVIENTLSVEWSRPQSDAPILHYETRARRLGLTWQGPVTSTTEMVTIRSSLVPSASYGVQVRAVSAIGAGQYSREVILGALLLYFCYTCTHAHISHARKHT